MLELFDRMAERVSVVEELAQARFLEVGGHMVRLDAYGAFDEFGDDGFEGRVEECLAVKCAQFAGMLLKDRQDLGVADEA